MMNLLKANEYMEFLGDGVKTIAKEVVKAYDLAKGEKLTGLFGDKTIVEKQITMLKPIEDIELEIKTSNFPEDIYKAFMNQDGVEIDEETERLFYFIFGYYSRLAKQVIPNKAHFFSLEGKSISTGKMVKFGGMKISKSIKHFFKDQKIATMFQDRYSTFFNQKKIKGTLCLSIDPVDYLTVSVNKHGWSSCFDTMKKGCYCASVTSLLISPNTFVAYLKGDEDVTYEREGREFVWNSKKWRAYVSLSHDNKITVIHKGYPYESPALIEEVKDMVAKLTGVKDFKQEEASGGVAFETPRNFYNDFFEDYGSATVFKTPDADTTYQIQLLEGAGRCLCCGREYDGVDFDYVCADCGDYSSCKRCGVTCHEEDDYRHVVLMNGEEEYVCYDCACEFYSCEECGDTYEDETALVQLTTLSLKDHIETFGMDRHIRVIEVCPHCAHTFCRDSVYVPMTKEHHNYNEERMRRLTNLHYDRPHITTFTNPFLTTYN